MTTSTAPDQSRPAPITASPAAEAADRKTIGMVAVTRFAASSTGVPFGLFNIRGGVRDITYIKPISAEPRRTSALAPNQDAPEEVRISSPPNITVWMLK